MSNRNKKIWFTSDHHFNHKNILRFFREDGETRIRPSFFDVESMNEYLIDQWNARIAPEDKVYHLGDIIISTSRYVFDNILPRLNGEKILIKGNHDNAKISMYMDYFKDIRSEVMKKHPVTLQHILFTHRPIRIAEENRDVLNVHGHIHQNVIDDIRYLNVSVENTAYQPLEWQEIVEIFNMRRKISVSNLMEKENVR